MNSNWSGVMNCGGSITAAYFLGNIDYCNYVYYGYLTSTLCLLGTSKF